MYTCGKVLSVDMRTRLSAPLSGFGFGKSRQGMIELHWSATITLIKSLTMFGLQSIFIIELVILLSLLVLSKVLYVSRLLDRFLQEEL